MDETAGAHRRTWQRPREEGMTRSFFALLVGGIAIVNGCVRSSAQKAYITNNRDNTVSVIDTASRGHHMQIRYRRPLLMLAVLTGVAVAIATQALAQFTQQGPKLVGTTLIEASI